MKTKEQICKDIEYLFGKIDWASSFLDAEAITIMNELRRDILNLNNPIQNMKGGKNYGKKSKNSTS